MDYFPPRIGFRIDKNFAVSLIFLKEESVDRSVMISPSGFPDSHFKVLADYHGRMAQLVEHPVQFNQLSGRSLRPPASSSAAAMKIAIGAYSPKHLVAWLSW